MIMLRLLVRHAAQHQRPHFGRERDVFGLDLHERDGVDRAVMPFLGHQRADPFPIRVIRSRASRTAQQGQHGNTCQRQGARRPER